MVRHIAKRSEHIPDRKLMHPARDWFIGLSAAVVLFVCSVLFAFMTFNTQSEKINRVVPVTETVSVYKSEEAQAILKAYDERITTFNALRGEQVDGGVSLPSESTQEDGSEPSGAIFAE